MEKTVSVVYHSGYGHTQKQAEAIAAGAGEDSSTTVNLISVDDLKDPESASWTMLDESDALVFGSPTYMGSVSAELKAFMELSSGRWQEMKWVGKLAAGFTNSGSQNGDKQNTLIEFVTFAAQHGMVWVNLNLAPGNNSTGGSSNDLNRLGASLGAMAQSNVDVGPDDGPITSDLETAKALGRRVALSTLRWKA